MKRNVRSLPRVVSEPEWQADRMRLLEKEKKLTRARDRLAAERRRLPMVEVEKQYVFEGSDGAVDLSGLFDGRSQLILYTLHVRPGLGGGLRGMLDAR